MSKDVVNFSLLNQALHPPGASASNQVDDADLFRKALSCCDGFDTKPKEKWARRIVHVQCCARKYVLFSLGLR